MDLFTFFFVVCPILSLIVMHLSDRLNKKPEWTDEQIDKLVNECKEIIEIIEKMHCPKHDFKKGKSYRCIKCGYLDKKHFPMGDEIDDYFYFESIKKEQIIERGYDCK